MRLVDAVFRQGHLSEQALLEAIMTGERPAHLDRCDICADRAVDVSRWLDDVRDIGYDAAEAAFPPEKLAAQHAQIMRKLEALDQPSRVISFPTPARAEVREPGGRRVAPAWVGIAAAAGLAVGIVGGQLTARMGSTQTAAPPTVVASQPPGDAVIGANLTSDVDSPSDGGSLLDMEFDRISVPSLEVLDDSTPSMVSRVSLNRGGD